MDRLYSGFRKREDGGGGMIIENAVALVGLATVFWLLI
jgi:hypothetical protein